MITIARNVKFEFRRGAGSSLEILFGKVTLTPTLNHTVGTSVVLPAPTSYDLINGVAIATNVAPSPALVGGVASWAYKVVVKDNYGKSWEFLVGVPDGTTEINFNVLPRYSESRPPAFGVGPAGPAGQSATIAIGSTTSGPTPAVTNSGTSTDVVLNFTLAKGGKGDKGEPGVSSVDWANAAANSAAAAEASKQAAIAASQLVDAPSDEVVRGLVASPTTLTYGSVRNAVRDVVSDVSPESTTDEAVKGLIETVGTQTQTALSATYATQTHSHGAATSGTSGFMPADDKAKIDAATPNPTPGTIAMRNSDGAIAVLTGDGETDATNKSYVDGQVGATARVIHYRDATYGPYEVITVRTGNKFVPGLVNHEFADNYQAGGTTGANFKPARKNLDVEFARTGYDILAAASGYRLSGNVNEIVGAQIKGGVIYHDFEVSTGSQGTDAIGFRADGTSKMYSTRWGDTAASMVADGVVDCFGFGPTLVRNGVKENIEANAQWGGLNTTDSGRQILGQSATGDIIIISVFGITGSLGIKGNECADIAALHGCYNAVMLDGGGSTQAMVNGTYSHVSSDASLQRPAPDFVAIRARVVNEPDTGWVDITYGADLSYPGAEAFRRLQIRRRSGVIYLRGRADYISAGTNFPASTWVTIGTIPRDFVIPVPVAAPGTSTSGTGVTLSIVDNDQALQVQVEIARAYVDMGAISYFQL